MGDKTLGGGEKIYIFSVCLEDEKRKTIGVKNKKNQKDRITYVDKSTTHE